MTETATLQLYLADDHPIFRCGIKTVFESFEEPAIRVKRETDSGREVLHMVRHQACDLLILDLNLSDMDGLEVLKTMKKEKIRQPTLVLTMYDDPKIIKSAFKSGADAYCLKSAPVSELNRAVNEVLRGETFMGQGVSLGAGQVQSSLGRDQIFYDRFVRRYQLTKREFEVLKLVGQAMNNKEIAAVLYISDQTVSVHRKNIMRKLGVSNTASLIKMAYDNQLV